MKKQTGYYIVGAVLVVAGIYLYKSKNKDNGQKNLQPPMEVIEEKVEVVTTTTENAVLSGLDKLKALIESIKSKGASTPPISA
jgi:uncharacterized protein YoxC